jgi:hypothetical protein
MRFDGPNLRNVIALRTMGSPGDFFQTAIDTQEAWEWCKEAVLQK